MQGEVELSAKLAARLISDCGSTVGWKNSEFCVKMTYEN